MFSLEVRHLISTLLTDLSFACQPQFCIGLHQFLVLCDTLELFSVGKWVEKCCMVASQEREGWLSGVLVRQSQAWQLNRKKCTAYLLRQVQSPVCCRRLFLGVVVVWLNSGLFLGLIFLQPFVQIIRALKYFAFDALSQPECFQSTRNDPRFFPKPELAVIGNQYCFVANSRIMLDECKPLVRNTLGHLYCFLRHCINFRGALCNSLKEEGRKTMLCIPVVLVRF